MREEPAPRNLRPSGYEPDQPFGQLEQPVRRWRPDSLTTTRAGQTLTVMTNSPFSISPSHYPQHCRVFAEVPADTAVTVRGQSWPYRGLFARPAQKTEISKTCPDISERKLLPAVQLVTPETKPLAIFARYRRFWPGLAPTLRRLDWPAGVAGIEPRDWRLRSHEFVVRQCL